MYPKQLLPLVGDQTMLQQTALRLAGNTSLADQAIVVCNEVHRFLVAEQMQSVGMKARLVLEPVGRNTAPAVALAALMAVKDKDSKACPLLLVMPADHVIQDVAAFASAIKHGETAAVQGKMVTFGVVPTAPHTGYGYIEADSSDVSLAKVVRFVEKPQLGKATEFVDSGKFYWNAGIFLFRADTYLEELEKYAPEIVEACNKSLSSAVVDSDFTRPDGEAFAQCPSDSIDYAVMEKTEQAMVVPLDAGWSDIGSWSALHAASEQDSDGNHISGDVVTHACRNSFVSAASRLVTAVGLEDIIVVEDKDVVMVSHKDLSQDVKAVVEQLVAAKRPETNLHRQVFRPWGSYDSLDEDDGFQVKRLIVNPGAILSLQKHAQRAEHWTVVRGTARITLDDKEFDLSVNESTYIAIGAVHRIANTTDEPVHIIEVQCGDYLGEDDIVRLEDNYGREGTNT